jgi:hypothetical protein
MTNQIDYEKLKEAQDLLYRLAKKHETMLAFEYMYKCDHKGAACDSFQLYGTEYLGAPLSINGLINKLKSLLSEPFDGWVLDGFGNIEHWTNITEKSLEGCNVTVYPTKQALIEAQIQHWLSLSEKSPCEHLCDETVANAERRRDELYSRNSDTRSSNSEPCEHEKDPDEGFSLFQRTDKVFTGGYKCKHCGEYYR